jgi:hypothetical protein
MNSAAPSTTKLRGLIVLVVALLGGFLFDRPAGAAMPDLTPDPKTTSRSACQTWAKKQSSEAIRMWGIQDDGTTSRSVAISRLADSCMGKAPPDIVGFGSSVEFDSDYCARHRMTLICDK